MQGLFRALEYLHDKINMIHRDVKLENIVIGSHKDYSKVKLIDFGLAVQSTHGNITDFAKCGTHLYRPPEQVSNVFSYAKKADIWAAGIVMYTLLCGKHPLYQPKMSKQELEMKIKNFQELSYPSHVSVQARHMLDNLCQKRINSRSTARDALKHPWITRRLDEELPKTMQQMRDAAVKDIHLESKLRKAMNVLLFCSIVRKNTSPKNPIDSSSATTNEETQQSASSLLNDHQMENYKQMIKTIGSPDKERESDSP